MEVLWQLCKQKVSSSNPGVIRTYFCFFLSVTMKFYTFIAFSSLFLDFHLLSASSNFDLFLCFNQNFISILFGAVNSVHISKADKSRIVYSENISYFFTSEEYDL